MSAPLRYASAATGSAFIVLGLFALIQGLLAGDRPPLGVTFADHVDFARAPNTELVRTPPRAQPHKPEPPTRPPSVAFGGPVSLDLPVMPVQSELPALATLPAATGRPSLGSGALPTDAGDVDVVPIFRDAPRYPQEALMNRTEGWVEIEFTIATDGSVKDAVVVDARPERVFERDALRAIARWKFSPHTVGGVAVERRARQVIQFALDQSL